MKLCSKCKIEKDSLEFYKDHRLSSGLSSSCKKCHSLKREKLRENEYVRFYHINRRYGIDKDEYNKLLLEQNNKCFLCKSLNENYFSKTKNLVVDHCHVSGTVRGLLCSPCNILLGNIEKLGSNNVDDFLKSISNYLSKGNKLL